MWLALIADSGRDQGSFPVASSRDFSYAIYVFVVVPFCCLFISGSFVICSLLSPFLLKRLWARLPLTISNCLFNSCCLCSSCCFCLSSSSRSVLVMSRLKDESNLATSYRSPLPATNERLLFSRSVNLPPVFIEPKGLGVPLKGDVSW